VVLPPALETSAQDPEEAASAHDADTRKTEVANGITDLLQQHVPPGVALHRCFRLLRPTKPVPREAMRWKGKELNKKETHEAWRAQLLAQSEWSVQGDPAMETVIKQRLAYWDAHIPQFRGTGPRDAMILPAEVAEVVVGWRPSPGVPTNALTRAAFKAGCRAWDAAVACLQILVGPGALAVRPRRWRRAVLFTDFKGGEAAGIENFRLIYNKVQMGLLQESLLFSRLKTDVWGALRPGQNGYIRDTADPLLVAHEVIAALLAEGRRGWLLLGDFRKAFPRTWREHLLVLLHQVAGVRDGAF